ncbi:MAG: ribonuclease PH [Myxococcota bacterium]|nr:ribonuclease PH [Myxococcota bacterium]
MKVTRPDGRTMDQLREISFEGNIQPQAAGSVLIRWGNTHVICAASVEDRVPPHRYDSGGGWLTAEYAMLPASGDSRIRRDRNGVGGRTAEIQRLIGRSLRAVFDLDTLGARTIRIDCDVLNADGGTRCASVTGAYIAACQALKMISKIDNKQFIRPPSVVGVSVGVVDGTVRTDLCYLEDSGADVDLNFIASPAGMIEIQGTAERQPFTHHQLNEMLQHANEAATRLIAAQEQALAALDCL